VLHGENPRILIFGETVSEATPLADLSAVSGNPLRTVLASEGEIA
jgi:hypothetical protein